MDCCHWTIFMMHKIVGASMANQVKALIVVLDCFTKLLIIRERLDWVEF